MPKGKNTAPSDPGSAEDEKIVPLAAPWNDPPSLRMCTCDRDDEHNNPGRISLFAAAPAESTGSAATSEQKNSNGDTTESATKDETSMTTNPFSG